MTETKTRSLLKALTWRGSATIATLALVYGFTGQMKLAAAVGGLEIVIKMLLYFVHERLWSRIGTGKATPAKSYVIWLTGLSGSGKSTIGLQLQAELIKRKQRVERLDGDVTRAIFPSTGFDKESRNANVKKAGFVASLLQKQDVNVVACYISPYKEARDDVRQMCDNFIEVYVSTPLAVCEERDVKGLYAKARAGEITQFTGIDDPYEVPDKPELVVDTSLISVDEACRKILDLMNCRE